MSKAVFPGVSEEASCRFANVSHALVVLHEAPSAHVATRDALWKTCFGLLRKDREVLEDRAGLTFPCRAVLR